MIDTSNETIFEISKFILANAVDYLKINSYNDLNNLIDSKLNRATIIFGKNIFFCKEISSTDDHPRFADITLDIDFIESSSVIDEGDKYNIYYLKTKINCSQNSSDSHQQHKERLLFAIEMIDFAERLEKEFHLPIIVLDKTKEQLKKEEIDNLDCLNKTTIKAIILDSLDCELKGMRVGSERVIDDDCLIGIKVGQYCISTSFPKREYLVICNNLTYQLN